MYALTVISNYTLVHFLLVATRRQLRATYERRKESDNVKFPFAKCVARRLCYAILNTRVWANIRNEICYGCTFPYEIYFRFITPYSSTLFVVCSFSTLFDSKTSNLCESLCLVAATVSSYLASTYLSIEIIDKNHKQRGWSRRARSATSRFRFNFRNQLIRQCLMTRRYIGASS